MNEILTFKIELKVFKVLTILLKDAFLTWYIYICKLFWGVVFNTYTLTIKDV